MKKMLFIPMVFLLVSYGWLGATSDDTLITRKHQVANIWVIDENGDGKSDILLIELYFNGKFDKILVFNEFGYYVGNIRLIDGVLIYTDLDGKATPFKLQTVPQIPLKQT